MKSEFIPFTPFNVYEEFSNKRTDTIAHIFRRPLLEYVERYMWLQDELTSGHLKFPLLEIGSGSGWGLQFIQKMFPHNISMGIDLDTTALSEGVSHGAHNLIQSNATHELPLSNSSFQTIVCFMMLEQLNPNDVKPFFLNLHRVAKPDAQFIIAMFNRELFSPNNKHWFTPNIQEYTKPELTVLLQETGWQIETSFGQRFVNPETYKNRAKVFQSIQDIMLRTPQAQQIRFFRIMTPRLLNIAPSLVPHTTVELADEQIPREPVINIVISRSCL